MPWGIIWPSEKEAKSWSRDFGWPLLKTFPLRLKLPMSSFFFVLILMIGRSISSYAVLMEEIFLNWTFLSLTSFMGRSFMKEWWRKPSESRICLTIIKDTSYWVDTLARFTVIHTIKHLNIITFHLFAWFKLQIQIWVFYVRKFRIGLVFTFLKVKTRRDAK